MTDKINIGILGCANIARKYAINSFQNVKEIGEITIASRDIEKSKKFAKEFSIKYEESYDCLIKNKNIDAVYIPLPIGLHEEWAIKAVKEKKHIICEKSLTTNLDSAKKIVDECKNNDVVLFENFMCEYHPQHAMVKSLIDDNRIGTPFVFKGYFGFPPRDKNEFRYNKELGGGCLNDSGAYTVFMARQILENEPISVTCNLIYPDKNSVDILGSAYLEFPNNQVAFIAFGFDNVYQNNYSIWGNDGKIDVLKAYSIPPEQKPTINLYRNESLKESNTSIDIPAANQFDIIFKDFCDTILNKDSGKIIKKYEAILNQAKIMEAMRLSSSKCTKIFLKDID